MLVEIGHFALVTALMVALVQAIVPAYGAHRGWRDWMQLSVPSATVQFALVLIAFGVLVAAFVASDFSLALVAANSHSAKPLLYKITGVWGNHEGSMVLWVLMLTLFGMCVAWFGGSLPFDLKARVLSVQSAITASFLAFILLTSNPFQRLEFPPFDGSDLNPLLQDPGLAFHPPFLYLGYVGLSVSYSFAVAALMSGKMETSWAHWVRPWTLASWLFLTIGIALGSWWAYYELGWGGWWFWDPVENASFIPWLVATALLHSAIVTEKRDCMASWTVLLAILAFSLSLVGTFLVRSGIITSVHSFASDPTRGIFILLILGGFAGGALALYGLRGLSIASRGSFGTVSRESALVANNVLLMVAAFIVFIGTFWPLIAELLFGRILSVGPPFFEGTFTPVFVCLAALLPVGAVMPWKRANIHNSLRQLWGVAAISLALGSLVWVLQTGHHMLAPIGFALSAWLILGSGWEVGSKIARRNANVRIALRRLMNLRAAEAGKFLAHGGLGLAILGISGITAWEVEDIRVARPGDNFQLGGYEFRFHGVLEGQGPNYYSLMGEFSVRSGDDIVAELHPERRYYHNAGSQTTEAAIDMGLARDIYMVIGNSHPDGGWTVRTYIKPLANWIWIGALTMATGGLASLSDRRLRTALIARPRRKATAMAG